MWVESGDLKMPMLEVIVLPWLLKHDQYLEMSWWSGHGVCKVLGMKRWDMRRI